MSQPITSPIPETIGPYLIAEKIGSGGMATVYRARDLKHRREVALKALAIHLTGHEDVRRRFMREARTLLQFDHPHILPVYDIGEHNGRPYLAMRLLSGRSLADLTQGQPLPRAEVGRFTRQIASALDYAHARGIIHRDIKPANILLDEAGNPYLADFGVAYLTENDSGARLTQVGAFVGTAAYASPEQCRSEPVDRPSDIYSLAVVVFEMATGRLPFESPSQIALMKMHLREPPPNPLAFNPSLPVGLYHALVKALAKLPEHRYPSAMKFSEAVDEALGLRVEIHSDDDETWLRADLTPVSPDDPVAWIAPPMSDAPALPAPDDAFDAEAIAERFDTGAFDDSFDVDFVFEDESIFTDAARITFEDTLDDAPDEFPAPDLILGSLAAQRAEAAPAPLPVIRPLSPRAVPPTPAARQSRRRTWLIVNALLLVTLAILAAGAILVYTRMIASQVKLDATTYDAALDITFDYPGQWVVIPANRAILSGDPTATILIADHPLPPDDGYDSATIAIAVQRIDPITVFGVPPECQGVIASGPARTFGCMAQRGVATPVYRLFDTAHFDGGAKLPGTLPPTRASLPVILLPGRSGDWLAIIIAHWDGYLRAQETLDRVARSAR